ncbi:type IV toxin-antitoxin system AbiEi family antitoxin domain-containing protein [Smaragdicoccus niigatensis]|uniref:type IV toxin-antitoxin system AbiEi family antitoxin domain-containing protein n=1 Tax=Smaragdicoccus niigatensis TaxID=359359 RepID=UPI0012DFA5A3|nr:type IV toxin-antitoxin system AbiEi family antitoxin domain-containing protein [Smaragdicoccus niigatensis]
MNGIFAAQDGIITRSQAFAAGMSRSAISRRVTSEEWTREAPCIYRRADRRMTPPAELRVAVYSAGDDAVAFGPSAAWWHGLSPAPEQSWVNIPVRCALEYRLHRRVRRRDLRPDDVVVINGLQVTSLPLTVLDSADPSLIDHALRSKRVSMRSLVDCHRRNASRSGTPLAGRLLAEAGERSRAAARQRLITILRRAGIDGWAAHVRVLGHRLDVAFADQRTAVLVDGWAGCLQSHSSLVTASLDTAGWQVLQFSWQELYESPAKVVAEVRASLTRP